ncbi:MAG TPA: DUF2304 domain-containing protein [Bryobacteraceae bacterium]|nr:DUF2304 domain-containing protein [Bryobacteraceae bacterium]
MTSLLNVTTILSFILLILVLVSVRRAHIRVEYSVSWLLASAIMLILSRARPALEYITTHTGIPDAPLTLFLITGGVFLLMFFRFSVIISHLRDDNIALAQRVAILEYHVRSRGGNES